MTFRPDVELDPGRVQDRRGGRVRGGGIALGGGLGSLVILALVILLGGNPADLLSPAGQPETGPLSSELATECQTGTDANERQDCRMLGTVTQPRCLLDRCVRGPTASNWSSPARSSSLTR